MDVDLEDLLDEEAFFLMEKHGFIRRQWDEGKRDWLIYPTEKLIRSLPEAKELDRLLKGLILERLEGP